MKRAAMILVVAFFVLIDSRIAWSWSGEGHRTVGAIADLILEKYPKVRERVASILGGNSLAEVSVWADCAKGFRYCHRPPTDEEKAFAAQNRAHHAFHYTDVPIQQTAYHAGTAGTADNDIVAVTAYAINVLREKVPNHGPAILNERDALWLLVHTVGDIHQPLHVGAVYFDNTCATIVDPNVAGARLPSFGIDSTIASTKGGNDLKISKSRNLHAYWDGGTVKGAMRLVGVRDKSIEEFAMAIARNPPHAWQTAGDPETWSTQWATEIMPLAHLALTRLHIAPGELVTGGPGGHCTWSVG